MKLLILGHAQHGKDTVAEYIRDMLGWKFESSSMAAARIFIYDRLKLSHNYKSVEECFKDRAFNRGTWHQLICEYNKDDKARLAKEILKNSDMYVGMRDDAELNECRNQNLFDYVLGVYDPRKPKESEESFTITDWELECDKIIINDGTKEDLRAKVFKLILREVWY